MAQPGGAADRSRVPPRSAALARGSHGPAIGPLRLTPFRIVIGIAFIGSAAFIAYAILLVRDTTQIPMLSAGFAVLGLATASVALGALIELWRSASAGRNGRALALAVVGGIVGLAAIGCFTVTILLAMLWGSAAS
jgi:chromate transport protein ChrA